MSTSEDSELLATIARLEARIAVLESVSSSDPASSPPATRRQLLWAGLAAVGGAAAATLPAGPAAAANGATMFVGVDNNTMTSRTRLSTVAGAGGFSDSAVLEVDGSTAVAANIHAGLFTGRGANAGVRAVGGAGSGAGVIADGGAPNGVGIRAQGVGTGAGATLVAATGPQLLLQPKAASGPPTSGTHIVGELWMDSGGTLWVCTSPTPGAGTWVRLLGVPNGAGAGTVTLLPKPIRLLDTRLASGGAAPYATGSVHSLTVEGGVDISDPGATLVPAGVSAAILNVTAVNATRPGFLQLYPPGITPPTPSTLNFLDARPVDNAATVRLVGGAVSINVGGPASAAERQGSTHVIVDCSGYVS
jgi:hypothetical protein